jgi:hypothetical protein
MSNLVEKFTYFVGDKEIEYAITEENGIFKGNTSTNDPTLAVQAQSLTEAKESFRQKILTKTS